MACIVDIEGVKSLRVLVSRFILIDDGVLMSFGFWFAFC